MLRGTLFCNEHIKKMIESIKYYYNLHKSSKILHTVITFITVIVFLPLLRELSPRVAIDHTIIYVAYLPISLFIALVGIYGASVLPALTLATWLSLQHELTLNVSQTWAVTLSLMIPLAIAQFILHKKLGRYARIDITRSTGIFVRLWCFGFIYPILVQMAMYIVGALTLIPDDFQYYFSASEIRLLILNLQSLMMPAVVFSSGLYYLLRFMTSWHYARKFYTKNILEASNRNTLIGWLIVTSALIFIYTNVSQYPVISSYAIPLVFLSFVYGVINFSAAFISLAWTFAIFILITGNPQFIKTVEKEQLLTSFSAFFIVFTIANAYLATMKRNLKQANVKITAAALREPLTMLPNMLRLNKDLQQLTHPAMLCYVKIFSADKLDKYLGFTFRVNAKVAVYYLLKKFLAKNCGVYSVPYGDLLIVLPENGGRSVVQELLKKLNQAKAYARVSDVDVAFGLSWMTFNAHVDLSKSISELDYLATTKGQDKICALDKNQHFIEQHMTLDIALLQKLKHALLHNDIVLYAQKIEHRNSDAQYYEILCRMKLDGEIITPDKFIPTITEFGLCGLLDFKVLEVFIDFYHDNLIICQNIRFSLNITPETLADENTAERIIAMFESKNKKPDNIVFEVTEEQLFLNERNVLNNIKRLRSYGFNIAIDDFGTGYANYERLKNLDADIVKIDGMFIKEINDNRVDQLIVRSIIDIARAKGMSIVAEYVETQAHQALLSQLGVDYLQGYYIAKPLPLDSIIKEKSDSSDAYTG